MISDPPLIKFSASYEGASADEAKRLAQEGIMGLDMIVTKSQVDVTERDGKFYSHAYAEGW